MQKQCKMCVPSVRGADALSSDWELTVWKSSSKNLVRTFIDLATPLKKKWNGLDKGKNVYGISSI